MRWRREPTEEQRKKDLRHRAEAIDRELMEAREGDDQLAGAIALNNLGTVHADLEEWEQALARYQDAAEEVPDDASLEDRLTPHGNAANAARRLEQWDVALTHALLVDAIATEAKDAEQQGIALASVGLIRRAVPPAEFEPLLQAVMKSLPSELQGFVRVQEHLNPTVVNKDQPGRNDPCPCGSGKKYKHCCARKATV